MRAIVAGSRYRETRMPAEIISHVLDRLHKKHNIQVVVSGTCSNSPDIDGEDWARANKITINPFPANWEENGKAAGFLRNKEMAANADILVAFWDRKSSGTKNMIDIALKIPLSMVYVIDFEGKLEKYKEGQLC